MKKLCFAFFFASTSIYGSTFLVTNPSALNSTDVVNWGQFGGDLTSISQTLNAGSTMNDSVSGQLASGNGTIVVAGTDAASGTGIAAGDTLLSTNDGTTTNVNAPLTLSTMPVYGEGAFIEGTGPGQFTANIQAFAGVNSVLDMSVTSDLAGDPIFIGVSDSSAEITSVVYSLTVGSGNTTGNFAMDSLFIQNRYVAPAPPPVVTDPVPPAPVFTPTVPVTTDSTAPEPGMAPLLAGALLTFGFMLKKRRVRI
jgi:hypothetical protein